jgi:hypothetical protein
MADWSTFRAALAAAFAQALPTSLRSAVAISWTTGAREFGGADGRILLGVVSDVEDHLDEADVFDEDIESHHSVTVQVTVESQHDDPSQSAWRLARLARLGLRKESVYALLAAAGISYVETPMNQTAAPYAASGRMIQAVIFDVTFATVFSLTPEADDAIGLIERVEADAELTQAPAPAVTYSVEVDDPTPET